MRAAAAESLILRVDGVSMGRTIVAGSDVVVRAADHPPRTSEVWAFCDDAGVVVVHRFRRRLGDGRLQFRGDGQPQSDEPVTDAQLIGRVTQVRNSGEVHTFGTLERSRFMLRRALRRLRR